MYGCIHAAAAAARGIACDRRVADCYSRIARGIAYAAALSFIVLDGRRVAVDEACVDCDCSGLGVLKVASDAAASARVGARLI